jgi:hypothetical protein
MISFIIASKRKEREREREIPMINATKEVKRFCNENYETLKTLNEGKTSHVHGLAELIL